ncbi:MULTISPECIES: hypothetical protein [unclassified Rhizobium]|uniref:hypothetical protein n=1 Tax=unclassified Rhizobium TaxID=2613769 RepID=UPI00115E0A0E|nr:MULTISPECIES: hypothetical protein [unclassified Rhizobium]TQX90262.1 hypothetical protein EQW76_11205 [Rhizobium sp. rho-13.1]TQY16212.1 hypothetical protein EQW74_10795 [Rhizobium sp. rho-1.1]
MDFSFIPNGFATLVRAFAKTPLAFIGTTIIIILFAALGFIGYMAVTNKLDVSAFVAHAQPAPIVEAQRLQESIPRDATTCAAIDELGRTLSADRATYWSFTNATYGLNQVFFNYSNLTCPFVGEGIAFIPDNFDKVNNSIFAEIHAVLFPARNEVACGKWTRDDIKSTYIRALMRSVGTDVVYDCGVQDLRGFPIGKIVVAWHSRDAVRDDAKILETIRLTALDIGRVNTPVNPPPTPPN